MIRFLLAALLSAGAAAQDTYAWLEGIAQKQLAQRRAEVSGLRTPEEIRNRGAATRAKLLRWIGGLPTERTPLNLRRTGTIERDGYRIEKIIFESQPRFYVTATLHVPTRGNGPFPAVLQPTGHSLTAKARGLYQSLAIGLAKSGFVVLTYDPLGQGERRIFFDKDLMDSKVGGPTVEHSMVGIQALLAGESIARPMIWDGIRGLDLLQSLPEVDGQRLGVAGCSGGGTLSAYIAAIDDRIKVAAPACYITSWEDQLKGTGPQDAEQQFPNQLLESYDHGDLVMAAAPKPYLINATTEDFFPIAGARRTFEDSKRLFDRFGAEGKMSLFVGPGGHGMGPDTRAAICSWMKRWLKNEPVPITEPEMQVELEEDLNASPTGQIATSLGGETVSTLNRARFAQIKTVGGDLPQLVKRLTRVQLASGGLVVETVSTARQEGIDVETLRYATGDGRMVPAMIYQPQRPRPDTILLVDATGKKSATALQLARVGYRVLAIDSALTGDTSQKGSGSADLFPQAKAIWLAMMVGRTVTGLRMTDISRGLDVLEARGMIGNDGVVGFGIGNPAVALLHAAVVDRRLGRLVLEDMQASYRLLATTPVQRRIFDLVIPDVLRHYDLSDLAASVAPRPVVIGNAISPTGGILSRDAAAKIYRAGNIRVIRRREGESPVTAYLEK